MLHVHTNILNWLLWYAKCMFFLYFNFTKHCLCCPMLNLFLTSCLKFSVKHSKLVFLQSKKSFHSLDVGFLSLSDRPFAISSAASAAWRRRSSRARSSWSRAACFFPRRPLWSSRDISAALLASFCCARRTLAFSLKMKTRINLLLSTLRA